MASRRAAPKLIAGNARAFGHGFELGPHDRGMHTAIELLLGEAAVSAGDHVFAANDAGESHDTLGY